MKWLSRRESTKGDSLRCLELFGAQLLWAGLFSVVTLRRTGRLRSESFDVDGCRLNTWILVVSRLLTESLRVPTTPAMPTQLNMMPRSYPKRHSLLGTLSPHLQRELHTAYVLRELGTDIRDRHMPLGRHPT